MTWGNSEMRKSRQEAAETRERIVHTAAHEFGQHGIAETGLADVMSAAGLTHGGFYKHFDSTDQFVAEAIEKSLDSMWLTMEKVKGGDAALATIVKEYVSRTHRDNTQEVCPLAALGSELQRAEERTRDAASRGILRLIALLEKRLSRLPPKEAKSRAHAIVAAMVCSVFLSLIVSSPQLSDSILRHRRQLILEPQSRLFFSPVYM